MMPGDRVAVDTSRGRLDIDSVSNPQNSSIIFLGIRSYTSYRYVPLRAGEFSTRFTYNLRLTIEWVQLIMINLAIFNMLPLYPLDGEGFVSNIIIGRLKHGSRIVRIALNIFSLSLLGSNMVLSFLRYGITPI
jgi:membrane-associated protease RseP (regulator of RpoE activity)